MLNIKTIRFLVAISLINLVLFVLITKLADFTAFLVTMLMVHLILTSEPEE